MAQILKFPKRKTPTPAEDIMDVVFTPDDKSFGNYTEYLMELFYEAVEKED